MKKLACLMLALAIPTAVEAVSPESLQFRRGGEAVASLTRAELVERCGRQEVSVADPYYKTRKTFRRNSRQNKLRICLC